MPWQNASKKKDSLVTLDFEGNHIGEENTLRQMAKFGTTIGDLVRLENLDLSYNMLKGHVETLLGQLDKGLALLDLSGCQITKS